MHLLIVPPPEMKNEHINILAATIAAAHHNTNVEVVKINEVEQKNSIQSLSSIKIHNYNLPELAEIKPNNYPDGKALRRERRKQSRKSK